MIQFIIIQGFVNIIPLKEEHFKKMIIPITHNTIIVENKDKVSYPKVNTIISEKNDITHIFCIEKIEDIMLQINNFKKGDKNGK